jgi:hypothetical protein
MDDARPCARKAEVVMDTPADYPALAALIARTQQSAQELAEAVRRSQQLREESRMLRTYRPAPLLEEKPPLH